MEIARAGVVHIEQPFLNRCPNSSSYPKKMDSLHQAVLRAFALAAVLLSCLSGIAGTDTMLQFDIPAGKASRSLKQFGRQAQLSIVFDARNVESVRTNEVVGLLEPDEALRQLLSGTSLSFTQDQETGAIAVSRAPIAGQAVAPVATQSETNNMNPLAASGRPKILKSESKRPLLALLAVLLAGGTNGMAQNSSETSDEILTLSPYKVSGSFAESIGVAVEGKRNADTTVEVVSAQDIGRLPDISVADSLSRLTGVSSQRTSGQSSAINIRGLSQQLTFATLNGREQVALNGDRTVEFEQFPSELLAGATVYKSPKASLIEGGIGGTVELQTIRPLDYPGRRISLNVRGSYSDRANEAYDAKDLGHRFSISYVDQFRKRTLGVAFGYARLEQPDVAVRFVGQNYTTPTVDFDKNGNLDAVTFGFDGELAGGTDRRNGLMGTIQWKPTDRISWNVDAYFSKFASSTFKRQWGSRVFTQVTNPAWVRVQNPIVVGDALVGGQFTRLRPVGQNGLRVQTAVADVSDSDELSSIGSQFAYTLTDRLKATVDVSYGKGKSRQENFVFVQLPLQIGSATPRLDPNISLDFAFNGTDIPTINAITPNIGDPARMYLTNANSAPTYNDDKLLAISGKLNYDLKWSFISSVEMGFRSSNRDASQTRQSFNLGTVDGTSFANLAPIALNAENSVTLPFHGSFARAGFPTFTTMIDPKAALIAAKGPIVYQNPPPDFVRQGSFTVSEDVRAGYAQADIDSTIMGVALTGNIGLRVAKTVQSSASLSSQAPGGLTYTETLPAANFVLHLTDHDQVRLAASRAMTRPSLLGLGAGFTLSYNGSNLVGGGTGNPALRPFLADQLDVSYERYFGNGGALVIGAFRKNLKSFIVRDQDDAFDYSGLNVADLLSPADLVAWNQSGSPKVGTLNSVINGKGGFVKGLEVGYTQLFTSFPRPFDGLGMIANYAYTESGIGFTSPVSGVSRFTPLPGLSRHVANTTLFYEKGGFSTRIGVRYRSEFVSPQQALGQQFPFTEAETVVDYQISYGFRKGSLKGLTLLFQVNNLTDQPVATYFGQPAQTGTIQYFGRQFLCGASYTF